MDCGLPILDVANLMFNQIPESAELWLLNFQQFMKLWTFALSEVSRLRKELMLREIIGQKAVSETKQTRFNSNRTSLTDNNELEKYINFNKLVGPFKFTKRTYIKETSMAIETG